MKSFALPLMRANLRGWGYWVLARDAGSRLLRAGRLHFGGVFLFFAFSVGAQSEGSHDYELKAEFMHNFAQFTEWPESAFASSNSPVVIAVLGDDPFGSVLDKTVRGGTIHGRPLVIERHGRAEEAKTCHILYISQSEIRQMDEIVKSLKGKPILTVTDAPGPAFAGVMIRFTLEKHRLHFHVNHQAAKAAGLTLSSHLLRLANTPPPVRKP